MIVRARKTTMDLNPVLAQHALQVLRDLVEIQPLPLAYARPTSTELEMEMHALLAPAVEPLLRKRQSQLLPRSLLTALARRTPMEMVPRALLALLALMHLLDPLQKLLASARPTSTELEMEMHALLAPTMEPLPCKRQSQLLPRSLLTALARPTPMEMVPHALIAQVILLRLLDPLPSLLAAAMRTFSELLEPLPAHAALVIMAAPLLSSHPQLPPQPLAANALRTFTELKILQLLYQHLRAKPVHAPAIIAVLVKKTANALLIHTGR